MRTIYIDSEFKCHVTNDGTMTPVETMAFYGKCDTFIEGHQFIPEGATWTREDGEVFEGRTSFPWKDYAELEEAQVQYERELLAELQANSVPLSELEAAYQEGVNSAYD